MDTRVVKEKFIVLKFCHHQNTGQNRVLYTLLCFFICVVPVHFHNNNSIYPTNVHSLLCKTLHRFANMFRSRGIIIRAPHTLNIVLLLYTQSVTCHDPPWTHTGDKNDTSTSIKAYTQYTIHL
jgi:hypothetical protein